MNTTSRGEYPNVTVGAGELAALQETLAAARAAAAALREQLSEARFERDSYIAAHNEKDEALRTAESLALTNGAEVESYRGLANEAANAALTNGEARRRAEAERDAIEADARRTHTRLAALAGAEARAVAAEAERDELRGALERLLVIGESLPGFGVAHIAREALTSHPAAIPEGTPTDRK